MVELAFFAGCLTNVVTMTAGLVIGWRMAKDMAPIPNLLPKIRLGKSNTEPAKLRPQEKL